MKKNSFAAVGAFLLVLLLGCFSSRAATELKGDDPEGIRKYEGEFVSVVGTVVSTHIAKSGKVRFLNFGPDYKEAFTAVLFTGDLGKFADVGEPTEYYRNRRVRVQGRVKLYGGRPEIILRTPAQIKVLE